MIRLVAFAGPVLLLSLSCAGVGLLCLAPTRLRDRVGPLWLYVSIAYFVGQGVLGTAFLLLALAGWFSTIFVATLASIFALVAVAAFVRSRGDCCAVAVRAWHAWRKSAFIWKLIAVATAVLFGYGFTSVAAWLTVDAPAFYMAIARMIAGTGRLTPLPGYDAFSSVGLLGELHMAALFRLGMSGTEPRVLPWVSFIPTLAVLYGLARSCGVGRRGSLLAVVMAITSSSVAILWGTGKTDLLAVGPALSACVLALSWWDEPRDVAPLGMAGLLTGFACVYKLSYLVAFLPCMAVLVIWPVALGLQSGQLVGAPRALFTLSIRAIMPFAAGFLVALSPNLLKNYLILGTAVAATHLDPFFSSATTRRLLLSYPFALTYGRYWGQLGTLSPLVLAFAPLALLNGRKSRHWTHSRVLAVSTAAVAGTAAWMFLFPSAIATRYILATLLLLSIPAAAAADEASRRHALLSWLVPPAVLAVLLVTPTYTNAIAHSFTSMDAVLSNILGPQGPCTGSRPFEPECAAHETINAVAAPGDRVLTLAYVRFWLRPDLLQSASRADEVAAYLRCAEPICSAEEFWARYRAQPRFRFVLHDSSTHRIASGAIETPPPGIRVRRLFVSGNTAAYEVTFGTR